MCAAPNHPGKPAGCTCSLLHRQRRTAHPPGGKPLPNERNEADSGSLALRPTPSTPAQGRRPPHGGPPRPPRGGHPRPRPGGLHVVRAIHMVNTSQLTSSAKLGLAFQRLRGTEGGTEGELELRTATFNTEKRSSGALRERARRGGSRSTGARVEWACGVRSCHEDRPLLQRQRGRASDPPRWSDRGPSAPTSVRPPVLSSSVASSRGQDVRGWTSTRQA